MEWVLGVPPSAERYQSNDGWENIDSFLGHSPPDRSWCPLLLDSSDHACFFYLPESSAQYSGVERRV